MKRLVIKTGEYTNQQGETKGEYVRLGSLMEGENGPYILMEPTVDLAGCLYKQNLMNHKNGKEIRGALMVSVFDDQPKQQQSSADEYRKASGGSMATPEDLDDDIPFLPYMKEIQQ